jgi:hypothetical protein
MYPVARYAAAVCPILWFGLCMHLKNQDEFAKANEERTGEESTLVFCSIILVGTQLCFDFIFLTPAFCSYL